ncbi:MAG: AAA family ATPase [Verrucomicrobiota bacterium]|nr:AAA family ATPase [Verrucomicrobiota bacterium]
MKILNLKFKNINSLAGEWGIDFSSREYLADGIFAITGPTGSGKTTILDAICLALYGETPRVKNLSKSSNEIMSKHTGECFSEVTFRTHSGTFRTYWSQRRARNKPSGALQSAHFEIVELVDGVKDKVLETKLSLGKKLVAEKTGMDFSRFTRSMLLAQGDFAVFLQASADERSPILEQITGTDIYSIISQKTFELNKAEAEKLKILKAELSGIHFLGEEELIEINKNLSELQKESEKLQKEQKVVLDALGWINLIKKLEDELQELDKERLVLDEKIKDFEPEKKRLKLAERALQVRTEHQMFSSVQNDCQKNRLKLDKINKILPDLEKQSAELKTNVEKAKKLAESAKNDLEKELKIIKRVRDFDLNINGLKNICNEKKTELQDLKNKILGTLKKQKNIKKGLDESAVKLKTLNKYFCENSRDETLLSDLSGIKERFSTFKELFKQKQNLRSLQKEIDKKLKSKKKRFDDVEKLVAKAEKEKRQVNEHLETVFSSLEDKLAGKELISYRTQKENVKDTLYLFNELSGLIIQLNNIKKQIADSAKSERKKKVFFKELDKEILELDKKQKFAKKEILYLQEKRNLLLRIKSLEDERLKLEDGKECPLCGATTHPFAEGNVPEIDETEKKLNKAESFLDQMDAELKSKNIEKAGLDKEIEQLHERNLEFSEEGRAAAKLYKEKLVPLKIEDDIDLPYIKNSIKDINEKITLITKRISEIEGLEKKQKKLSEKRYNLQKENEKIQENLRTVSSDKKNLEIELLRMKKDHDKICSELDRLKQKLLEQTKQYGISAITIEDIDETLKILQNKVILWNKKKENNKNIESEIFRLQSELSKTSEFKASYEKSLEEKTPGYQSKFQELEEYRKERKKLYGEKDTDDEEIKIKRRQTETENLLKKAIENHNFQEKVLSEKKNEQKIFTETVQNLQKDCDEKQKGFLKKIEQLGFFDEVEYKNARMEPHRLKELKMKAEELSKKQVELKTRQKERSEKIKTEKEKNITEENKDTLEEKESILTKQLEDYSQKTGVLKQRKIDDKRAREIQKDKIKTIEKQQKECSRWEKINNLIGSADGKKFRNFAQGITFQIMIKHANMQLKNMSDRYVLVRDETKPLELNVVDDYQGGEIRSTQNLSGGESFIVSLSLALGLSQMASNKVRVDSLFLDEGFGTLDEDALETALETLSGLRQDGKLIGIISHVTALKERIATQIQIIPLNNGKSIISGPGCIQI